MQFLSIQVCHGHGVDLSWANEETTTSGPLNGGKKVMSLFLFPIRAGGGVGRRRYKLTLTRVLTTSHSLRPSMYTTSAPPI